MKKLILVLLAATVAFAALFFVERFVLQGMFGPSSMLAFAGLIGLGGLLLASYLTYETRFREVMARVWLVLTSIVVAYLTVDLVAGAILITPLSPELTPDEFRHHKLAPNTFSKFEQRDFSYVQRVNNLGLRGEDTTREKPPGVYRILMLGDSFTMGKGVEDDETFSALLQKFFDTSDPVCGTESVEVLNGGVDSYAPVLEHLQLTRELASLEPDLVVLNLDVSDLVQETAYRQQAIFDSDGEVKAVPGNEATLLLNERIRNWIENNLYLTRLALFYTNQLMGYRDLTIRGVVEQANMETALHTLAEDPTDRTEQWRNIFDSLSRIQTFADEQGFEFLLTIYPWGHQVSDSEWLPGRYMFIPRDATVSDASPRTVERLARENGIDFVSLFPAFRSYSGSEPLYFSYDPHWTTTGHQVMAAGLGPFLRELMKRTDCQ